MMDHRTHDMDDVNKLNEQLIGELTEARERLSNLEKLFRKHRKIEETLRESEERYRALTENTSDWIWETDTRHRCVYTNARVKDILGYEPEEILGKPPTDFMTGDELNRLRPILDELRSAPRTFSGLVSQQLHKDGSGRWLEINIVPIFKADGNLAGFRGITRDVTARRKIETALRESEKRFHLVSQAANDAIYDWDIASGTIWLSEAHRDFLGFPEKGNHIEWWQSHLHPADRERIKASVRSILKGLSSTWTDEYRFLCADGRYIDIVDRGQVIRDEKGSPIRIVGSMMDVTARKLAEASLHRSEENYRLLIEDSPIGIIVYKPDSSVIMSNSRARQLLDVTEDGIVGKLAYPSDWVFLKADGSQLSPDEHPVNQVITHQTSIHDKMYGIARPAVTAVSWYLVSAEPQWDKAGRLLRIIVSFIDITARREAQEALAQSEAKYRFLTEKMSDIVWTTDMDLTITYISPSVQRALDYKPEELLGRKPADIMTSDSLAHALVLWEQELARNQQDPLDPYRSVAFESGYYHRNGAIIWFDNVASFIRDYAGKITGIYGVSRDITEQKLAATEREKMIAELTEALSEVKTLSGLLPICSHCKKIRDDKGYWNQLESYITEHSDALFSHGICPECAAKLYPDFFPGIKK